MSIKNDGHYFCGAGGNIPDGSDEALTDVLSAVTTYRCLQGP
ncbi:copper resistance protein [Salmonella enterica]|uniref:Copper resistance protein n=1 Tax=Salmonella enterica TaxID=28901 RepID=A0A5U3IVK1_SALER|nr:copper resistance protein [Salmonella enterica]